MITDEMVEAALREFKCWVGDGYSPSKQQIRAALEAAERAAWRPISEAPDLERVIVSGIQPRSGTCAAYRWYYEDFTDGKGVPMDHPTADLFRPLPNPPEAA